ncbi:unnamed protein product [Camellia sinensis]
MQVCGLSPDLHAYSVLLAGLCKNGHIEEAICLFESVKSTELESNIEVVSILINGMCRAGKLGEARKQFDELSKKGLVPDVVTYNIMINGLCKKLFLQMEEKGCSLDSISFNIMIQGFLRENEIDKAMQLFGEMHNRNFLPNEADLEGYEPQLAAVATGSHIDAIPYSGKYDGVVGVLGAIQAINVLKRFVFKHIRSLEAIMFTSEEPTRFGISCLSSRLMESTPTSSSGRASSQNLEVDYGRVYTVVIVNCTFPSSVCHGGSGRQLLLHASTNGGGDRNSNVAATIEALSDSPWKLKPISLAIKSLILQGPFFHNLSSKGLQPNVKSYTMMIKGLCEEGLLHEAKELFLKMEQNGCLADDVAYNTIIQGFVRRHKCYEALILVEDMVQRDFSTDASIFPLIIDILSTKGQDPALQEVIKKFMPKDSRGMQENE